MNTKTKIELTDKSWNPVKHLTDPLHWREPRRVFVSDLFHEDVSFEFTASVFAVMGLCQQHMFIIATKRPDRECEFLRWVENNGGDAIYDSVPGIDAWEKRERRDRLPETWPLPNVRILSIEPMLGPIDLTSYFQRGNEAARQ